MKFRHFWHRGSAALFALTLSVLLSVGLVSALSSGSSGISITALSSDTPQEEGGDGYQVDDNCGFLQGTAAKYAGYQLDVKNQANNKQACLDAFAGALTGLFYQSSSHSSYVNLVKVSSSSSTIIDLAPTSIAASNRAQVNLNTGKWSGYGKIVSPSLPTNKSWVWFNWVCRDTATCATGMAGNESNYWVTTNMDTGVTQGYAWSDYIAAQRGDGNGFIKFDSTTLEVPPQVIVPYVEVEANNSDVTPGAAARETAPQANGIDYWRVGIYFVDMVTGSTLDESDIKKLTMSINTTDSVFVDQVKDQKDAVDVSSWHPTECSTGVGGYCVMTKADGTVTFNQFVRSYGPTSNMIWMDEKVNGIDQEESTDRDGCLWTYLDQIELASLSAPVKCFNDTSFSKASNVEPDRKWDYFYARSDDRNYIYLDDISFNIEFNPSGGSGGGDGQGQGTYVIQTDSSFVEVDDGMYLYTPGYTELSFSPRFIVDGIYADYDGYSEWTSISEDLEQTDMYLNTSAYRMEPSTMVKDYLGASINPKFTLTYQLDAGTTFERDAAPGDVYLVMDTVDGNISDYLNNETYHEEQPAFSGAGRYSSHYAIGYGQRADECSSVAAPCSPISWASIGYISDPTAELWVCDNIVAQVIEKRGGSGNGCYFVAYLPVLDRHADAGGVLFMGSTSEFLGSSLDDSDDIYAGGVQETVKIRNNFYELGTRYTLGVEAGSGSLDLDASSAITGDGESLIGGSLFYFNGDVDVEEATSFSSATLYVLGGDVYINGDIGDEDSRLGIIALSQGGVGGNVYISPDVTDLYVNIFADGMVMNQHLSGSYDSDGFPSWINETFRLSGLKNQLYLNGSISARMPLNQDNVVSELGYSSCDGSEITEDQALECTLESLRQFRLCYEIDATTGGLGTSLELCDEGEMLSDYGTSYAATDPSPVDADYYPSVILDYTSPGNLPIFASEGIFN